MSGVNHDGRDTPGVKPRPSHARRNPAHAVKPVTTRPHWLANAGTMILHVIALALLCAAIGAAAALLLHPPAAGSELFVPSSSPQRGVELPGSVEQVAAKVLPSVVTLQTDGTGRSGLGSGIILTSDGLIMTNYHVVTLAGSARVTVSSVGGSRCRGAEFFRWVL
jgi:putative serine protease PepD